MIPNEMREKAYFEIDMLLGLLESGPVREAIVYQTTRRPTNPPAHTHIMGEILKEYKLIEIGPSQEFIAGMEKSITMNGIRALTAGGIREYMIDTDPAFVIHDNYPMVVSVVMKNGLYLSKHLIYSSIEYSQLKEHFENEDVHYHERTSHRSNGQIIIPVDRPTLPTQPSPPPITNNYHNKFLRGAERMKKKRVNVPRKTQILLQKEIGSICPFCPNEEVEHFQIHHIDGNPANNKPDNLLMVCPTCHSKITKGDIMLNDVKDKKCSVMSKLTLQVSSSFTSIFSSYIEAHKKIVEELNAGISEEMEKEADILSNACGQQYNKAKGFFELLYRILHLRYKGKYGLRDLKNAKQFFYDYDWKIGHYVSSFISILTLIEEKLGQSDNSKAFIPILQNVTNSDQLRLIFYYIVTTEDLEKRELIRLFRKYDLFKSLNRSSLPLIYPEDLAEYTQFPV